MINSSPAWPSAENAAPRRRPRQHGEQLKLAIVFALSGAVSGMLGMLGHFALSAAASRPATVWKACDSPELVHESEVAEPPLASNQQ